MKIIKYISVLPVMAIMCACQSEAPQTVTAPKKVFTVKASLPSSDNTRSWISYGDPEINTRTHVTYGNTNPDFEFFRWHITSEEFPIKDCITVFNLSKLSQCPEGIQLETTHIDGNIATFETLDNVSDFSVEAGDIIFVNYWDTKRAKGADNSEFFKIDLGNSPQLIVDEPTDSTYMTFMQGNLKMYDIVRAVQDDKIPDLHFKHLSAILRVTLRNKTGNDLWPKDLFFECPDEAPFFAHYLYCSIDTMSSEKCTLLTHEIETDTYTNKVSTSINNYTAAETPTGTFIKEGETYDLYVIAIPKQSNNETVSNLNIFLEDRYSSSASDYYTMTLNGFDRPIEAGKRYWFKLTAGIVDGEKKLMLNSQWNALHPEDK